MPYVKIVPAEGGTGPTQTQGTKVFLEGGSELEGVYRIVLTADVNNVWRAEIHCHPRVIEVGAEAVIHEASPPSDGPEKDVTDLSSTSKRWRCHENQ